MEECIIVGKCILVMCAVALTASGCKTADIERAHDPAELERAWQAAIVQVPREDSTFGWYFVMRDLHTIPVEGR